MNAGRRKKAIALILGVALLLSGCGSTKGQADTDNWVTTVLEGEKDITLTVSLPPDLTMSEVGGKGSWWANYHTDCSNFQMLVYITESDWDMSEETMHPLLGSDVRYISQESFEDLGIMSPDSEKSKKEIHDVEWLYYALSGATKWKKGGAAAVCEYVYFKNTDIVQVTIQYSSKDKAPQEELDMLTGWFEEIPKTMELSGSIK